MHAIARTILNVQYWNRPYFGALALDVVVNVKPLHNYSGFLQATDKHSWRNISSLTGTPSTRCYVIPAFQSKVSVDAPGSAVQHGWKGGGVQTDCPSSGVLASRIAATSDAGREHACELCSAEVLRINRVLGLPIYGSVLPLLWNNARRNRVFGWMLKQEIKVR